MAEPLFTPGDASDRTFYNLLTASTEPATLAKHFCEGLWNQYCPLADDNFLIEIRTTFHARFWEMYLTCALLARANERGYRVSCPKPGPDILLEFPNRRIWIEAVTATNGKPGHPDTVLEPELNGSSQIPDEKLVLRYTNAFDEKHRKYQTYRANQTISPSDAYVIAINAAHLAYRWVRAAGDPPRFLKALYPIGLYYVSLDRASHQIVGHGNHTRFHVTKANTAAIPVQAFTDSRCDGISAVLCSMADVGSFHGPVGSDFELAYNPYACTPILRGDIGGLRGWRAEFNDVDGQLTVEDLNG